VLSNRDSHNFPAFQLSHKPKKQGITQYIACLTKRNEPHAHESCRKQRV